MPVHDWTRVSAGTFHHFHGSWIIHLSEALNGGVLPDGYYAMSEQRAGEIIPDVLALERQDIDPDPRSHTGAVAVAEAPPQTRIKHTIEEHEDYRLRQKTLTVRETGSDRLVAIVEIASPSNKDRSQSVSEFVHKLRSTLKARVHVMLLDLIPPGMHDPGGLHAVLCDAYGMDYSYSEDLPLALSSYVADREPIAYVEPVAVGQTLIDMPLFLETEWYVPAPLERTYMQAFNGMPSVWKELLQNEP